MFLNVMTPLIMVISFSDSMQLTFAARDQLMAGKDKRTAFRNAIRIVGPACVLTHAAQSAAGAASPFEKFVGVWRGAGEIVGTNGHRESIRCRAQYTEAKEGFGSERVDCVSERKLHA